MTTISSCSCQRLPKSLICSILVKLEAQIQRNTVKLGDKEHFDKEQIGVKELFTDYQPFYTINLLLDKELLPI